jgi:flagellar basal body-associated protein FliL
VEKHPEASAETPELMEETSSDTIDVAETPTEAPRAKKEKLVLTPEMKKDPLSRKLITLSLVFASLAAICIGLLTYVRYEKKKALHSHDAESEPVKTAPIISQAIEEIHVVLQNEQHLRIEIVAECAQIETCDHIKNNPAQVRDLLIPVISNIDSNLFSNLENKKLIRKKITDRLNTMEMTGKVIQVHFNNLSIEGSPR